MCSHFSPPFEKIVLKYLSFHWISTLLRKILMIISRVLIQQCELFACTYNGSFYLIYVLLLSYKFLKNRTEINYDWRVFTHWFVLILPIGSTDDWLVRDTLPKDLHKVLDIVWNFLYESTLFSTMNGAWLLATCFGMKGWNITFKLFLFRQRFSNQVKLRINRIVNWTCYIQVICQSKHCLNLIEGFVNGKGV